MFSRTLNQEAALEDMNTKKETDKRSAPNDKNVRKKKSKIRKERNSSQRPISVNPLKRITESSAMEIGSPPKKKREEFEHAVLESPSQTTTAETTSATDTIENIDTQLPCIDEHVEVMDEGKAQVDGEQVRKVDNARSIFISNLLFSVDETHLREKFQQCGPIDVIRLVKNRAGKSKGYAYLQFLNKESVSNALLLDRESLLDRPMFVSSCVDKKKNPTQFKFPTQLDKRTLYVSNLPFELTSEELTQHFTKIAAPKQVRLVTNRSGKSKGYAYVEYETEGDANTAVLSLDQKLLNDRPINVALSKPPSRKVAHAHEDKSMKHFASSRPKEMSGNRGRAKTQLSLIPRSLNIATIAVENKMDTLETNSSGSTTESTTKMSTASKNNSDFRQFLLKK